MQEVLSKHRGGIELRTFGDKKVLKGYIPIGEPQVLYEFEDYKMYELLSAEVLRKASQHRLKAYLNHNRSKIFGSINKNMSVKIEAKSIEYEVSYDGSSVADEVFDMVERGYITESSFGFWHIGFDIGSLKGKENHNLLTYTEVKEFFDVSPVSMAAYEGTQVTSREKAEAECRAMIEGRVKRNKEAIQRAKHLSAVRREIEFLTT